MYSTLTPEDVEYLNSLIVLTAKSCKDAYVPVIRREFLAEFIRQKWQLPNPLSTFIFNQMALSAHRTLKDCPLRINAPSANKYILADSAKRVVDWILSEHTHRYTDFIRHCESLYLTNATNRRRNRLLKGKL